MNRAEEIKNISRFTELTIKAGMKDGFPLCCISQFIIEQLYNLHPAQIRIKKFGIRFAEALYYINNIKKSKFIGYVPCDKCAHKFIRQINKIKNGKKQEPNH